MINNFYFAEILPEFLCHVFYTYSQQKQKFTSNQFTNHTPTTTTISPQLNF